MDREMAYQLLCQYTQNENLRRHGLAVEAAMRAYARKYGQDEEKWAVVGLIHDFDYEAYPDQHPQKGGEILRQHGYPEDIIYAVLAHGDHLGLERRTLMDKALYAVDELTGLVTAVALVRPTKSIFDVDAPAVRRKMKDKAFARSVRRDDIVKGAADLGVDLDEHITLVIGAMREVADALGLRGAA